MLRRLPIIWLCGALALTASSPSWAARARRRHVVEGAEATSRARARALIADAKESVRQQQVTGAISTLERATELDPESAEAFFQLGHARFQRGFQRGTPDKAELDDVQQAVEAFQTALALDPKLARLSEPFLLRHDLGQCLEALGRYDEAAEQMRLAAEAAPRNPMPFLYAAELRWRMRDAKKSADNLYQSVQRARRIQAFRSLARLVRTHPQFAGMSQIPQNQAILAAYDQVEAGTLSEGEAREAVEERLSLRDALRDSPTRPADASRARIISSPLVDPRVHELLEEANADFKWRKFRRAIVSYQAALQEDASKGTLDSTRRALILENIGASYRQLGLTGEAVRVLEKASQEMPQSSSVYYQLALSLSTAGQFTRALHALSLALKHAASTPDLRKTLLMARTDVELEPVRDLPGFQRILSDYSPRARAD